MLFRSRRRRLRGRGSDDRDRVGPAPGLVAGEGRLLPSRLWSALNDLPFDQRTVIVLREIDGLSYEEIAFSLGVLDYCSTGDEPVEAGGSTFLTERGLRDMVAAVLQLDQFAAAEKIEWEVCNDASELRKVDYQTLKDFLAAVHDVQDGKAGSPTTKKKSK